MKNRPDVLSDIDKSFRYFSRDFKEKDQGVDIYFALDNDVFNMAIFPFDKNIKYADIFSDIQYGAHSEAVEIRAKQLAIGFRSLSKRGSMYVLPPHRAEYIKTIYHFFKEINTLKSEIDFKKIEDELAIVRKKIHILVQKYIDNNYNADEEIRDLAPLIFKLINNKSRYEFAAQQIYSLTMNEGKIRRFEELVTENRASGKREDVDKLSPLKEIIKKESANKKTPLALDNDFEAFEAVIGFNELSKEKKLILVTGDAGLNAAYKEFENAFDKEDEGWVRQPKYFVPFISEANSNLYQSANNRRIINDIESLLDNFLDSIMDATDNASSRELSQIIEESSKKTINSLKGIIDTGYTVSTVETDVFMEIIKTEGRIEDFIHNLKKTYEDLLDNFAKFLSFRPAIVEILNQKDLVKGMTIFHRYPFILYFDDDEKQEIFGLLIDEIVEKRHVGSDQIISINEKFPLYAINMISAIVMIHVNKLEKAKSYLQYAEKELEKEDGEEANYYKGELKILRLFYLRKMIIAYDNDKDLIEKNTLSGHQKVRYEIEAISYKIAKLYCEYFNDKNKNNLFSESCDLSSKILQTKKLLERLDCGKRKRVKSRALIQLNVNIANLYVFNKYFLEKSMEKEATDLEIEIIKSKNTYKNLYEKHNNIGIRKVILGFMFFMDNGQIKAVRSRKLIDDIYKLKDKHGYLSKYEEKRLNKMLYLIEDKIQKEA